MPLDVIRRGRKATSESMQYRARARNASCPSPRFPEKVHQQHHREHHDDEVVAGGHRRQQQ